MSATHFDADDAAQDRALERRTARARARGEDPDAVDLDTKASAVAAAKGKPGPAAPDFTYREEAAAAMPAPVVKTSPAFTPVLALPSSRAAAQPRCRQELIEYAITHPGQWLRYEPGNRDRAATGLYQLVRKREGGFIDGFECKIRNKLAYVRYVEPKGDGQ